MEAENPPPVIRFINYSHLKSRNTFPRYPEDKDLTTPLDDIDIHNTFMVFISHCWLRGWIGADGYDTRPHPDNASHDKFALIKEAVEKAHKTQAPGLSECYVWLDFACINQDTEPAAELKQLDRIIMVSDMIITPLVDSCHHTWEKPASVNNWFLDYKAPSFCDGQFGYLNRAWCRVEMFYASNIPFIDDTSKKDKFAAGMKVAYTLNRRPHALFGTKESINHESLIIVPPLKDTYLDETHPLDGFLSQNKDRMKIRMLMESLPAGLVKRVQPDYTGERNEQGEMHGRGRNVFPNGMYTLSL